MRSNRQIKLVAYAEGVPEAHHFRLDEVPLPDPGPGEIVAQTLWLSMDPFPRLRISGDSARAPQLPLGSTMIGRGLVRVVASRHEQFAVGDYLAGEIGWQEWYLGNGESLRPIDPALAPVQSSLGVLGPSGLAAYFATLRQGDPQPDETVVVSAAAGSVGSVACQIARMRGARVVGIVGGTPQAEFLRTLGVTPVNYKAADDLSAALGTACPDGVNIFIDTVGGAIHDTVMKHLAVHARIVLVGTIANYNLAPGEPELGPRHLLRWIMQRVRVSGFLVADYAAEWPAALHELAGWVREGRLRYTETVFEGFEQTPRAFAALFGSESVGKILVRVSDGCIEG
jgi:hypothetical protein